jgi:hypothetical protein
MYKQEEDEKLNLDELLNELEDDQNNNNNMDISKNSFRGNGGSKSFMLS